MTKYKEWLSSLGDSAISPANPFKNTHTISSDGSVTVGGTTSMSGYTLIEADSLEAVLSAAKACPFFDIGGSLEVSELIRMSRLRDRIKKWQWTNTYLGWFVRTL